MATDLERLVVSLDADIRKFDAAMRKATATFNSEARKVEVRSKALQSSVAFSLSDLSKGFAVGAGFTAAIVAFKNLADAATRTQNSLKIAGLGGAELTAVYQKLFAAAQENATPIEELTQLYARASLSQKDLGASTERMVKFTENVSKALRVQGGDIESARGALLQLSQALGGGTVRAEEFNSIQEGALPVLQAVAAGLKRAGGSVAELRRIMLAGELSSKDFFDAFERGAPLLDEKLKGSVLTIGQALTKFNNTLQDFVGRIDSIGGVSSKVVEAIGRLSTVIDNLGKTASLVANSDLGAFVGKLNEIFDEINPLYRALEGAENLINNLPQAIQTHDLNRASEDINVVKEALTEMFNRIAEAPDDWVAPSVKAGLADLKKQIDENAISAEEAKKRLAEYAQGSSIKGAETAGNSYIAQETSRFNEFIDAILVAKKQVEELKNALATGATGVLDQPLGVMARPNTAARDTSIYSDTVKRNEFFQQRDAEAMKTDLEKNVDTRAKAIIEAANKVGISLNEAAARIQARSELAAETAVSTTNKSIANATDLIKQFEGFRPDPYWDKNAFRVGYGSDTVTLADGTIQKVVQGMKISVEDANRDLARRIGEFQQGIRDKIGATTFDSMNEQQQAALTSIAYNYGSLPQRLVDAIKTGSTESVYEAIRGLRTDNGGINASRRDQEAQLYLTGAAPGIKQGIENRESFQEKLAEQQRMLQQLKEETGLRASLNPLVSDYGRKLSELEKAQELLNLAQQEGTAAGRELTSATQLLTGDLSKLTPEARTQAEAMRALATQYGQTSAAAEQLKASQEAAVKSSTESLELAKSVVGGILTDIRSALSDGKITWKEWGQIAVNALNKVADKLQEMLLNQLFSPNALGGLFGGLGTTSTFTPTTTLGGFLGFDKGGYTGAGGKYQAAGIVHKGEYVFDQESVRRIGLPTLRALQQYADGGYTGGVPGIPMLQGRHYGPREDIHVVVDDEGSLRAYVQREGRRTEARIATTTKSTFDNYRRNELHSDISGHAKNPRRRG